jgi:hypothetical protein
VIEQRVLGAQDPAVHKRRLVARDSQRHRLHPLGAWEGLRRGVLRDGRKIKKKPLLRNQLDGAIEIGGERRLKLKLLRRIRCSIGVDARIEL